MKTLFFLLLLSTNSFAKDIHIESRIQAKEFFRNSYPIIYGKKEFSHANTFRKKVKELESEKKKNVLELVSLLDDTIPPSILRPLVYWKVIQPNNENVIKILSFLYANKIFIYRDFFDHPESSFSQRQRLESLLEEKLGHTITSNNSIHSIKQTKGLFKQIANTSSVKDFAQKIITSSKLNMEIHETLNFLPHYTLSYLGLVPGNKVQLISQNDTSIERMNWFNKRLIFGGDKPDWDAPYIGPKKHIAFIEDPIFKKITDMIDSAQESIFIDIFLFGGTMGMTISKHLIDSALKKKNPNLKVLLLHDYATNYNMKDEIMPIFNYIKRRIEEEPQVRKRVTLLQANIQRHPPGIPFGLTNLIPKTPETFKFLEQKNTYYESKIDHSKVIVIDANTKNPQAYFGSKNWSDHSGGYYYDDAIWVLGPAAALVQASYLHDIEAALTEDPKEQAWFYYKDQGFDNQAYLPKKEDILSWFKIKRKTYPRQGDAVIRIAEADVDGKVKNTRNILIDMIINAKKNIYMEQLFIYDPYIVDALIKKKIRDPQIDIKIIADHNGNFGFNGFPNTIFMKDLSDHGIELKARKTGQTTAYFANGGEQHYHQENHRKITSVDGKVILGGSSNLNPDTLQGSFREFGAQVYSKTEAEKFEKNFLEAWNDNEQTHELDINKIQLHLLGKDLSPNLSQIVNGFVGQLYRSKDKLEQRH